MKSKIINAMLTTAKDLKLNSVTMKEIELLNLKEIKSLSKTQIRNLRARAKISQSVMAKILNIKPSTYQKWERGEVIPKGCNLKLLRLAHDHGLEYIM